MVQCDPLLLALCHRPLGFQSRVEVRGEWRSPAEADADAQREGVPHIRQDTQAPHRDSPCCHNACSMAPVVPLLRGPAAPSREVVTHALATACINPMSFVCTPGVVLAGLKSGDGLEHLMRDPDLRPNLRGVYLCVVGEGLRRA